MEDRRNVGENSCKYGDGTDQTGPILDVYDDDGDDDERRKCEQPSRTRKTFVAFMCIFVFCIGLKVCLYEYNISFVWFVLRKYRCLGYSALNVRIVISGEFDSFFIHNMNTRYWIFHSRT